MLLRKRASREKFNFFNCIALMFRGREPALLIVMALLSTAMLYTRLIMLPCRDNNQHATNNVSNGFPSLASTAYPLANPKDNFTLLEARGVVAGTCADKGWDYVFSFANDMRTKDWDNEAVKSHRTPGVGMSLCGYDYEPYFDGVSSRHVMLDIGANQGLSLMPYYAKGWRIIAFEPIPDNVHTIRRNIFERDNNLRNGNSNSNSTAPPAPPTTYMVTVPQGIRPGMQFAVDVAGQRMMVTCPQGVQAGMNLRIQTPEQQQQSLNSSAGQNSSTTSSSTSMQMFALAIQMSGALVCAVLRLLSDSLVV